MTQYIPMIIMILVAPTARAEHELLFNRSATELLSSINEDFLKENDVLIQMKKLNIM